MANFHPLQVGAALLLYPMKLTLEIQSLSQLHAVLSQIESLFTSAHTDTWEKPRGVEIADAAARVALAGNCELPADVLRVIPVYRQLVAYWPQKGTPAGMSADSSYQEKAVARWAARKLAT